MDTVRAWKDPYYRRSAGATAVLDHPAGTVSLDAPLIAEIESIEAKITTSVPGCHWTTITWLCC
jgi:mersacidin/lichenicidin family type 2 lantibiotic